MTVSIEIIPLSSTLDMFGEPDKQSAYALSGHVSIRLVPQYAFLVRRKPARFLLQSLTLTFEGQTEVVGPSIGYSGVRLCAVKRELVNGEPVEISNEGLEESNEPCCWNVLYNLPIAGWLPATSRISRHNTLGTSYALYATAKLICIEESRSSPWLIASLCVPFQSIAFPSIIKTIQTAKEIVIRRSRILSSPDGPSPTRSYLLDAVTSQAYKDDENRIPPEVIDSIQLLVTVPEYVDVKVSALNFTVRFRSTSMSEDVARRFELEKVDFQFDQSERFRLRTSERYRNKFPLPDESMQPPRLPLSNPNALWELQALGFLDRPLHPDAPDERCFSLIPSEEAGAYNFTGLTRIFEETRSDPSAWYTMEFSLPFEHRPSSDNDSEWRWAGSRKLRPTRDDPLFSIRHKLAVSVLCKYESEDGTISRESLTFSFPIKFIQSSSSRRRDIAPQPTPASNMVPSLDTSAPYAQTLPIYSELYDPHGERKVDYSDTLPVYTRHDSGSDPSSSQVVRSRDTYGDLERKDSEDNVSSRLLL